MCKEVSPVEQDTTDCEYSAYFEKKTKINYERDVMQPFSADAAILLNKKTISKVTYYIAQFFLKYCQPAQNQPKSHLLFHKNGSLHDFYTRKDFVWTSWNFHGLGDIVAALFKLQ